MTRTQCCASLLSVLLLVGAGCGAEPDEGPEQTPSVPSQTSPETSAGAGSPELGELSVVDGCAKVSLATGAVWAESCLGSSVGVVAVRSQTFDGTELALLRFEGASEVVDSDPASVAIDQADGWALVESPTSDFTLTFRSGSQLAVCDYNPFFIDCDVLAGK